MNNHNHLLIDCTDPLRTMMLCKLCNYREPLSMPLTPRQFQTLTADFIRRHHSCTCTHAPPRNSTAQKP